MSIGKRACYDERDEYACNPCIGIEFELSYVEKKDSDREEYGCEHSDKIHSFLEFCILCCRKKTHGNLEKVVSEKEKCDDF